VIWLEHGRVRDAGEPLRVSQDYYAELMTAGGHKPDGAGTARMPTQQLTGKAIMTEVRLSGGAPGNVFKTGESLTVAFAFQAQQDLGRVAVTISIYRGDGDWMIGQTSRETGVYFENVKAGETRKGRVELAPLSFAPGEYMIAMGACSDDYSLTYALTDLSYRFTVRSAHPTWGKFFHPARWIEE
jgi:hypothetical protein